ncbi:hypothetical protein [Actinoplanes palleronii]|uniref:Scaffolding protein n=1 Tax=Actinoplanes palleronii TaxID=113570 RepID=A0ABQ4BJ92_9ACTN|nr:hypothetical protein [Actinoplanes palleronii]GIE70742.1 hypothetical protein Apa02nite_068500 [Actinoplanes palleronii]
MTQPEPTSTEPTPGDPAPAPTAPVPAPSGDQPLGPSGIKALQTERKAREELEKQLAALAPLQKLAEALGTGQQQPGGPSEVELLQQRFADLERTATEERSARWRLEVAAVKGLTPQQAARLQGSTVEELTADADALLTLFPAAPAGPRTPVPDPSQGARGGQPGPDLQAQIAEAQAKGDYRTAISLERQKLQAIPRPS